MWGFIVFDPIDLSSDHGGDEDSPLPDQSLDDNAEEEEYEEAA